MGAALRGAKFQKFNIKIHELKLEATTRTTTTLMIARSSRGLSSLSLSHSRLSYLVLFAYISDFGSWFLFQVPLLRCYGNVLLLLFVLLPLFLSLALVPAMWSIAVNNNKSSFCFFFNVYFLLALSNFVFL